MPRKTKVKKFHYIRISQLSELQLSIKERERAPISSIFTASVQIMFIYLNNAKTFSVANSPKLNLIFSSYKYKSYLRGSIWRL